MLYSLDEDQIVAQINRRNINIGFIGLGRVGLPLAATLAQAGFQVNGVDIKRDLVAAVNAGDSPYSEENGLQELISEVTATGKFSASLEISSAGGCQLIIISVPTLIIHHQPEIEAIKTVARQLGSIISPGMIIVLQSTVPPFTTREVLAEEIARQSGLQPGKDFGLAYSPERTQSPQVLKDLKTYPKIVGGIDAKSTAAIAAVYAAFAPSVIKLPNIVAAEIEKLIENTYRDVNIAFANELARLCALYGVDTYDIISTANSQPYCNILKPGLVGGHCIPMDPYYLISDAHKRGFTTQLIKTAREINESVFDDILSMLDDKMSRVTMLGLSFKPDVRSFATSHTVKLVKMLQQKGYQVTVHDPFFNSHGNGFSFKTSASLYQSVTGSDCIILSTAHSAYRKMDFEGVSKLMRGNLFIDVRGMFSALETERWGLHYRGIGRI